MPPEPAPDPSPQGSALCPRHGLRYDPRLSTGCVRCRRTRDESPPPYAGLVGAVLVLGGLVALAIPLRTSLKAYFSFGTTPSASVVLPPGASPKHRRCLLAEGTPEALAAVERDCEAACEAGWGASCRRLAGLCAPDATLPPGPACTQGALPLLQRACTRQDPIACALSAEQSRAEILWKACNSGLGPPCAELAPLCEQSRAALTDGAPTTAWSFFAHPALRQACSGGPDRLHEMGCAHGHWSSCEHPGAKTHVSPQKLRELLERACDQADSSACRRLAAQIHNEDPGTSSALLAYARDLDACTGPNCPPVRRWRDRLSEERPRAEQQSAATREAACIEQGYVASCWAAAEAYALGEGVAQDPKRADELNTRARTLLREGCSKPGGDCASPDALRTLEACDHGDGGACLTAVQTQGGGTTGDAAPLFRRGVRNLRADCDRQKGAACWALAGLYEAGKLPGGEEAQIEELRKGCDGRHGRSCHALAQRTAEGRGVPRGKAEADRLFRRASEHLPAECEAGDAAACSALVEIFGEGKGVPRDEARAKQFQKPPPLP
jgi:TPR repeat protein